MSQPYLRVLLIEDSEDHAELFQDRLKRIDSARVEAEWVQEVSHATLCFHRDDLDVVLLDLHLEETSGLETLRRVLETETRAAIIVLSSLDDKEMAFAALKEGADDYLVKSQVDADSLERAIRYAMQRKESQMQVLAYADQLEQRNEELRGFVAMASHDLQAPLRNVLQYCTLVRQRYGEKLDADGLEFIDFVIDATDRMKMLVKDLLDYCQIGTESMDLNPIDANVAVTEAIRNLKLSIDENDAVVNCHPLPTVNAELSHLVQLFQNLIDNAVKYQSDEPPRIDISAERRDGRWRFAVRDNGVGIPFKFQREIFESFRRLYTQEEQSGTGLGLAICKKLIGQLGGDIWVESAEGAGSTFYFTLQACEESPQREPSVQTSEDAS